MADVDRRILQAHVTKYSGRVWRAVRRRRDHPWPPEPAVLLRPAHWPARWNLEHQPALYTSVERATAAAEAAHHAADDTPPIAIELHPLRVRLTRILDVSEPDVLATLGLERAHVSAEDYGACHRLAAAARDLDASGLLVPSARRWPETNLVVYTDALTVEEGVELALPPSSDESSQ